MKSSASGLRKSALQENELKPHSLSTPMNDAVRVCDSLEALVSNGLNEVAELSLWRRQPPLDVQEALNSMDLDGLADFRMSGLADDVRRGAQTYLQRSGFSSNVWQYIQDDIAEVLRLTCQEDASYTLRLEYVDDDACRRFHKDSTDFRIITAYAGRGTQWGEADGKGNVRKVNEFSTFHVGLFLGKRCPGGHRILHRSPPLDASDQTRFLMVMDIERASWRLRASAR